MILEVVLLAALVATASFTITGRMCVATTRLRRLDYPNPRSLHKTPTPRTGGLAILASAAAGLAAASLAGMLRATRGWQLEGGGRDAWGLWVVGATSVVAVVSLLGDWTDVGAAVRLIVHCLAAMAVVVGARLTLADVTVPLVGSVSLGPMAVPVTLLFLVWMTNLYNFMDGMDGFAGSMTVFGYGFLAYAAFRRGEFAFGTTAVVIVAAAVGFLYYNWPPAKIFMGDTGSVPLGFLAGTMVVKGVSIDLFDVSAALLCFAPFVVDASVTLARRLFLGERPWEPHREHFYQRLVLAGWGPRRTVLAEGALMLGCAISAVLYLDAADSFRAALVFGWAGVLAGLAFAVRMVESGRERKPCTPR
jgi:UDP-N-acetylmuramyl pentapeptide phosphotransferase/UDP-N-acetylglucosamine-1-phosphate transferase